MVVSTNPMTLVEYAKTVDDPVQRGIIEIFPQELDFMRLLPITPYSFLNYAFGLTGISFGRYFLASLVGIVPNVLALLWTAHAAGELAAGRMDWRIFALLFAGAGLFAALAWLPRRLRRNRPDALPVPGEDEAETEE